MCISDLCVCVWASDLSSSTCCAFEISIVEPGQAKTAFHFYYNTRPGLLYIQRGGKSSERKRKERRDFVNLLTLDNRICVRIDIIIFPSSSMKYSFSNYM
jgi:hypothetical protein